jgi:type I restriction enzyme R subunit
MTEFKQIIGRGTRLYPDYGKSYFTIMDFRNATRLFADPEFDGEPVAVEEETNVGNDPEKETSSISGGKSNGELPVTPYEDGNGGKVSGNPPPVFHIGDDVPVTIIHELEQFIDADGKLVAGEYRGYSKKKILEDFSTLDVFLEAWNKDARKQAIIDALREKGVSLQALREESGNPNLDDFDLICHIAFDRKPLTKSERAKNVQKRDFLSRYEGLAREVLAALLEKYSRDGIADFASIQTLTLAPFKNMAGTKEILSAFGGKEKYIAAVKSLEDEIYAE